MSFGFVFYDDLGVPRLSSQKYGFSVADTFTVSATSSGTKRYEALGDVAVRIVQTQQEPSVTTKAAILSFSGLTVTGVVDGADYLLSWIPRFSDGNAYPVTIYVLTL